MAEIHIHRTHGLGQDAALQLARDWQAQAERDWDLRCTTQTSPTQQQISFERPGLQGSLRVSAEALELELTLGFLLSAYQPRIEQELQQRLDGWLGAGAAR